MPKSNEQKADQPNKPEKQVKVGSVPKTNVSRKKVEFVTAKLNYLKISPKKVRLVSDLIKSMPALEAVDYLKQMTKLAARPLAKLISSAIANAANNFELDKKNLIIKNIIVNQGPTLKRWQPRAHGRATPIRKRSSHVEVTLVEKKVELNDAKNKKNSKSQAPNSKQIQNSNNQKSKQF